MLLPSWHLFIISVYILTDFVDIYEYIDTCASIVSMRVETLDDNDTCRLRYTSSKSMNCVVVQGFVPNCNSIFGEGWKTSATNYSSSQVKLLLFYEIIITLFLMGLRLGSNNNIQVSRLKYLIWNQFGNSFRLRGEYWIEKRHFEQDLLPSRFNKNVWSLWIIHECFFPSFYSPIAFLLEKLTKKRLNASRYRRFEVSIIHCWSLLRWRKTWRNAVIYLHSLSVGLPFIHLPRFGREIQHKSFAALYANH